MARTYYRTRGLRGISCGTEAILGGTPSLSPGRTDGVHGGSGWLVHVYQGLSFLHQNTISVSASVSALGRPADARGFGHRRERVAEYT